MSILGGHFKVRSNAQASLEIGYYHGWAQLHPRTQVRGGAKTMPLLYSTMYSKKYQMCLSQLFSSRSQSNSVAIKLLAWMAHAKFITLTSR